MVIPFQRRGSVNYAILIILLTGVSLSDSTQLSFTEGGQAEILYHYNQEQDLDVQIRIGDRVPFYHHGNMVETGLSPDQSKRFSVDIEKHTALGVPYQMFLVRVKIENVSREDAGTYICSVCKNDHVYDEETKMVGLRIEYPPGKADCVQGTSQVDTSNRVWSLLKCTSSIGSHLGFIECYQNGERVPPWTRPNQNRTTLKQTLWIRNTIPLFCCSSSYDRVSNMCSCKDFVRDYSRSKEALHDIHPCPLSTVSPTKFPSTKPTVETNVETSSGNSGTTTIPFDKKIPLDCIQTSQSNMSLSITLVFTVLNTLGIAIMITMSTFSNQNMSRMKEILGRKETKMDNKSKEEMEPLKDENANSRPTL